MAAQDPLKLLMQSHEKVKKLKAANAKGKDVQKLLADLEKAKAKGDHAKKELAAEAD